MPWPTRTATWIGGWLTVALLLRLAAAGAVEHIVSATPGRLCLIEGDAQGYWDLAGKIVAGEEYSLYEPPRRILRMPGFPVILAVSRGLFGEAVFPTRCWLAVISTLGCGLTYWLARELDEPMAANVALAATSLSPPLVAFSPLLLSETSFATALVGSLIPIARLLRPDVAISPTALRPSRRWISAILAGVSIAIATYIRPTWLLAAPAAAIVNILGGRDQLRRSLESLLLLVVFGACLFPWAARNHAVSGHWIGTTLWVGPSLYDGLNPDATGDSNMTFFDRDNLLARMSEYDMDQEYRRRAWQFVADHPMRTLELAGNKALRYWSLWPNAAQFQQPLARWILILATLPLFVFALIGGWSRLGNWRLWSLTALPILFFCAVHLLFVGSIRYRLPAELPLWILAGTGVLDVWRRGRPTLVREA